MNFVCILNFTFNKQCTFAEMKRKKLWPALVILLLGCIWGSSFILIKRGLLVFEPIQVAGLRQFLAGLILLPWVVKYTVGKYKPANHSPAEDAGDKKLNRKDYSMLFVSGIIGNGIPAFLFSYAGTKIPSGLSGILNAFTPMFTLLIGVFFFTDKFTRNGFLGVMAGIAGAAVMFAPGIIFKTQQQFDPLSVLMVLSAAMMYGYNINLIKHKLHHLPAMIKTSYPFFFMGMLYLLILIFTGVLQAWDHNPEQAWISFGYMLILGVIGSAVSMIIFNILIKHTSALVASTNTFIIPIVAVAWGLIDKEPLTWNMIAGLMLSLLGVWLVMRKDNHLPQTEDDVEELKEFTE